MSERDKEMTMLTKNIRKTIADILDNGKWHDVFGEPISMGRVTAYAIADALIEAGIGWEKTYTEEVL